MWRHPVEAFANEIEVPGPLSSRDVVWQTMQSMYAIGSGGLLGQGPVMALHNDRSSAKFIHRGGRIPAPMQSLKN